MSGNNELDEELKRALVALVEAGSVPPTEAWELLVEWEGAEATRALINMMESEGEAAIHAVRILAERGDVEAVEPMIGMLINGGLDKLMRDEITFACHKFGERAAELILAAWDEACQRGGEELMLTLLEAALETGATGRQMNEALARQVEYDPAVVRRMLAEYEATDEVVELLEERAAAIAGLDDAERPEGDAIQAIWNTIEQLDGEIPDALRRQVQPATEPAPSVGEALIKGELSGVSSAGGEGLTGDGQVGRNDPCPCGSGRKCKQCCMQ